jgi:hypothetical protein
VARRLHDGGSLPTRETPEFDAEATDAMATKDEGPLAGSNRVLRIVPPLPKGSSDGGRLAATSPGSEAWLEYYAAAARGASERDREQALRTHAARKVVRVLMLVVLAVAAVGYAVLR